MITIHLQPDIAQAASRQIVQNANQMQAESQVLHSRIQQLVYAWQGPTSDQFIAEMGDLLRRLDMQAETLTELAFRMEREISEWEQIDQRGASVFRSSGTGLWSDILPQAAGGVGWLPAISVPLAVVSWRDDLPAWLRDWIGRFFPNPEPVVSPLAVESGESVPPIKPISKLGELLEAQPEPPVPADETSVQASSSASVVSGPSPDPIQPAEPVAPVQVPDAVEQTPQVSQPQYDVYNDVPVKSQGALYGSAACAPTSVSMVLDYFHNKDAAHAVASPQELIKMLDKGDGTPGSGVSMHLMTDDLGELGYNNISVKVQASLDDLAASLKDGPVIVTTGVKLVGGQARDISEAGGTIHALVIKGINADSVVLNDPWSGAEKVFSRDTFGKMWDKGQNGMYVIRP